MAIYENLKRFVYMPRVRIFDARLSRKRAKLDKEYDRLGMATSWPPIPYPSVNFNQRPSRTINEYRDAFLGLPSTHQLPFLRSIAKLDESSSTLDFGCGIGFLAAAFAVAEPSAGRYLGYEPERRAREWLQRVYARDERFRFGGTDLPTQMNYATNRGNFATARENYENRVRATPDLDALKALIGSSTLDLQVTNSVFTHMWPDDIVDALKAINTFADRKTVFVNTWEIIDEFAERAMENGDVHRKYTIEVDGVLTYSHSNPLSGTGYRLGLMEDIYRRAGHEIVEIRYGSWSGRENNVTYQDIVVSKLASGH